jgi:hypothetical protein
MAPFGLLVNTIFGPVEIAGAIGDYGRARFSLESGEPFER